MTHISRALQRHDLSGEGISYGSYTYFFKHTRTWKASRNDCDQLNAGTTSETTLTLKTIHIIHSHIHSNKAEMRRMIKMTKMIFGDLVGLKLPDICLTGEEKTPKNTSPRKLVPTGDRTRARCVTSAHATTCSTAVDT